MTSDSDFCAQKFQRNIAVEVKYDKTKPLGKESVAPAALELKHVFK